MTPAEIDEGCRRRFEKARRQEPATRIEDFLPDSAAAEYLPTLVELVLIDLEFGWRSAAAGQEGPLVENYLERFPPLQQLEHALLLLRHEYELRRRAFQASPSVEEYRRRFPQWVITGRELLDDQATVVRQDAPTHRPSSSGSNLSGHVLLESGGAGEGSSRYTLTRLHAEGGLGRIWVARDGSLDREVALKELKPQQARDVEAWQRFLREAQVTGQLEHPNIVPVYEFSRREDQQPFYTMRLIRGRTMRDAIADYHARRRARHDEPLGLPRLLQSFISVCHAVSYAHSRGVIHRDLKPENIVLGDFGEVLVLDWGLARMRGAPIDAAPEAAGGNGNSAADATAQGTVVGTPAYMAPEQAAGRVQEVDERADVFGLGGILFEILTGRPPRTGATVESIVSEAAWVEIAPPRQLDASIAPPLNAICRRALAQQADQRYAAAKDVADEIQRYLADEPVTAYREPLTARLARWTRRHRTLVAVSTAVTVLLAIGTVVGLFWWQQTRHERQRQAEERIARIRSAALADELLALNELGQGHFATADEILSRLETDVPDEREFADFRDRLIARADRVRRLAEFYRLSDEAERLEFFEYDDQAEDAATAALQGLGVLDEQQWWEKLPGDDLSARQASQLREDVFRQLILLGAIRAKRGLIHFADPRYASSYRGALDVVAHTQRWRPSQSARVLEVFSRLGLNPLEAARIKAEPPIEPTSAADLYFVGLMQYWIGQAENDAVSLMLRTIQPLTGMDFSDSLAKSERLLRSAASQDPRHYWTWFMLGWNRFAAEDFATAELLYGTCVALRPEYALGYTYRGLALVRRAQQLEDATARAELLKRGVADAERAQTLEPRNPEVVWLHAIALALAEQAAESCRMFVRAVELEPPLETWAGRRVQADKQLYLGEMQRYAELRTTSAPEATEGWVALAVAHWMLGAEAEAEAAAERALQLDAAQAHALAVRGRLALSRRDFSSAQRDLQSALARNNQLWIAALGLAAAHEAQADHRAALREFERCEALAECDWQHVAAHLGRSRALAHLLRPAEAAAAIEAARRINPRSVQTPEG